VSYEKSAPTMRKRQDDLGTLIDAPEYIIYLF